MSHVHIQNMHGLGDNLHSRAVVRHYLRSGATVWLSTPWPQLFADFVIAKGLKLVRAESTLRTQQKNVEASSDLYQNETPPADALCVTVWYDRARVVAHGSVLGAMLERSGVPVEHTDFRLPVPYDWMLAADKWLPETRTRPILFYRPLVMRTEWGGCERRNPDVTAYQILLESLKDRFFVISVADLVPGKEWLVHPDFKADLEFHRGELSPKHLVGLMGVSALCLCSPGFAVIMAQAVGTPVICVFGAYENSSSMSGGARYTPTLGIDPIVPCDHFSHTCQCSKTIDLERAHIQLEDFLYAVTPGFEERIDVTPARLPVHSTRAEETFFAPGRTRGTISVSKKRISPFSG